MSNERSSKTVISNSIIYTITGLLQKCFTLILLPLYTAHMSTEQYGISNIANTFVLTMSFVVAFSLFSAVLRFYVDLKDDIEKLRRFYGTVIVFTIISWVFYFLLMSMFRGLVSEYIFAGVEYYPTIFLCLLSLFFNCQHEIYGHLLRSQQKALKASVLGLAYFLIQVSLNILLVAKYELGANGIILSTLIAGIAYTLYFWLDMIINKTAVICMDISLIKEALKYSIPVMPHNLSTRISMLVSSALIGGTATLSTLGIYSVAAQFGNMSDTILTYVNNAYTPWLFENLHNPSSDYKSIIKRTINAICMIIGLFFIGIALFAQDYILLLLGKNYSYSWRYVPLIVTVYSVKIIYYFYVSILFYYKKATRVLFVSTLTSSFINVILSFFLIARYGAFGSILADGLANTVCVAIVIYISAKFDDVGLKLNDFIKIILFINVFVYLGHILSYIKYGDTFSIDNLLYKVAITLIYVFICILLNRNQIRIVIKRLKEKKTNATNN